MFAFLERLVDATGAPPPGPPPATLAGFYWHFARQNKALYFATFVTGLAVALADSAIPVFLGKLVTLMSATDPTRAMAESRTLLFAMAALIFIGRPLIVLADNMIRNNAIAPGVTSSIRWQSHWHVVRQSLSFFQNDFAGRIANRVMSTAGSVRESIVSSIRAVWYIAMYGASALVLLASANPRLAIPIAVWFVGYGLFLRFFVPRLKARGKASAEAHSALMGRVVDSYSNILTVKLFARSRDEDAYVRDGVQRHREAVALHMRTITMFQFTLTCMNAMLLGATGVIGMTLWSQGVVDAGAVAMALPMAWQISNLAGWVSWEITSIFENIGSVQEGMQTIAVPHQMVDGPTARELSVPRGEIRFDKVTFAYDQRQPVLRDFNLTIRPGERIGLVGRSGAGKSTLVNLLLRFYDVGGGQILIDGHNVAQVTQESLRGNIGVVTQDTSLLHRSIAANIGYGKVSPSQADIEAAARRAQAHEFIVQQRDAAQRGGYEALVGERGVKLSGGQRQRVAIARVLLKNAPILILDEATSALDSEVEASIQEQLLDLMDGKTVIAIAHRLSTIARMDRLVVLDQGRIVEQGRHDELLAKGGHYADLWRHQSGGFLNVGNKKALSTMLEPPQ